MVSFDGGSARKVDDVTALPSRHKIADMCYYGNVMTTRWWLCVTILHLQQYSHRMNLFFFLSRGSVIMSMNINEILLQDWNSWNDVWTLTNGVTSGNMSLPYECNWTNLVPGGGVLHQYGKNGCSDCDKDVREITDQVCFLCSLTTKQI